MPLSTVHVPEKAQAAEEGWSMAKLFPQDTGLPMAVWITENDGYQHDVRVKVSKLRGGKGAWRHDSVEVGIRPEPKEIVTGSLSADDFKAVAEWIKLNRETIIDYWNDGLSLGELHARLKKLPAE